MLKRILVIAILVLLVFQSTAAFAQTGQTIILDMLYGAAIGTLLGAAVYAFDQEDFGDKIIYGAAIGTIGGFVFGITEATSMSFVEIEDDKVTLNAPSLEIVEKQDYFERKTRLVYKAGLLTYRY
jgi:hypothetical protein